MADQAIDYAALAKQAGAVTAAAPPDVGPVQPAAAAVDYTALAAKAGAVSSAPAGPSAGTWEDRGIGGKVWHPASGVTERSREDNSLFGMPPEFAALSGLAIARAVGAPALTAAARAVAGIKAVAGQALPVVKYEVTKTALEKMGVPSALSIPVAMMVSGYKRGGKAEAAAIEEGHVSAPGYPREVATPAPAQGPAAPHLDLSTPVSAGTLTSEQIGERIAAAQAQGYTPPPVAAKPPLGARMPAAAAPAPVPAAAVDEFTAARAARQASPPAEANLTPGRPGGNPALPDQVALNAEAIARRRAAYVASQQGAPAVQPIVKASGQMKLTAPEFKEFQRLTQQGMPPAAAAQEVKVMRDLAQQFGLATPTAADTRFPKGTRR
jgi:hypothetical protein